MSEQMNPDEFREFMRGRRIVGRHLVRKGSSQRNYSKKSDPPKATRCGGIVKVIVDESDVIQ